ncbi:MAG: DUF3592 domain-containing protein [Verrucomicrobiae bacterium]|nr:DUF3592 domain-containing protein [Verrucomicrobiae bacterium]
MILFGLPFCLPGLALFGVALLMNANIQRYRHWQETTATLIPPPAEANEGEKPSRRDENSFEGLTYRYQWLGRSYVGTTVNAAFEMRDSNDPTLPRLRQQWNRESSVPAWVNPSNPREAILIRPHATFAALFLLIFVYSHGLSGAIMIVGSAKSLLKNRRRKRNSPEIPWLCRAETGSSHLVWTYVALTYTGVAGWMALLKITDPIGPMWTKGICVALLLPVPFLLRQMFRSWTRYVRARKIKLQLPSDGLVPGEKVVIAATGLPVSRDPAAHQSALFVGDLAHPFPLHAVQADESGRPIVWEASLTLPKRDRPSTRASSEDDGSGSIQILENQWEVRCENLARPGEVLARFELPAAVKAR